MSKTLLSKTFFAWATPGALLAAMMLAGCGGGGGGGGGGSSPNPISPTPTPGTLSLTATAPAASGHGYVLLTLPTSTASTYSLLRAPAGSTNFAVVSGATGLSGGTTYVDVPPISNGISAGYQYEVSSSSQTSSATSSVTVYGPASGTIALTDTNGNSLSSNAPFTQSGSSVAFGYTINANSTATESITATVDASYGGLALSDIQTITLDGSDNPNAPVTYYTPAQLNAGSTPALTISGNTIYFNSANLPSGITVPVVPAGGSITMNLRLLTAHNSSTPVVAQATEPVPTTAPGPIYSSPTAPISFNLNNHLGH